MPTEDKLLGVIIALAETVGLHRIRYLSYRHIKGVPLVTVWLEGAKDAD